MSARFDKPLGALSEAIDEFVIDRVNYEFDKRVGETDFLENVAEAVLASRKFDKAVTGIVDGLSFDTGDIKDFESAVDERAEMILTTRVDEKIEPILTTLEARLSQYLQGYVESYLKEGDGRRVLEQVVKTYFNSNAFRERMFEFVRLAMISFLTRHDNPPPAAPSASPPKRGDGTMADLVCEKVGG